MQLRSSTSKGSVELLAKAWLQLGSLMVEASAVHIQTVRLANKQIQLSASRGESDVSRNIELQRKVTQR